MHVGPFFYELKDLSTTEFLPNQGCEIGTIAEEDVTISGIALAVIAQLHENGVEKDGQYLVEVATQGNRLAVRDVLLSDKVSKIGSEYWGVAAVRAANNNHGEISLDLAKDARVQEINIQPAFWRSVLIELAREKGEIFFKFLDSKSGNQALIEAAKYDHDPVLDDILVKEHLRVGVSISGKTIREAFIAACEYGQLENAHLCLNCPKGGSSVSLNYLTDGIQKATECGHVELSIQLLRSSKGQLLSCEQLRKILVEAIRSGHSSVVLEVLKRSTHYIKPETFWGIALEHNRANIFFDLLESEKKVDLLQMEFGPFLVQCAGEGKEIAVRHLLSISQVSSKINKEDIKKAQREAYQSGHGQIVELLSTFK